MSKPDGRSSVSATVPPELRSALEARAEAEDRDIGRVARRALVVYLTMDPAEADRLVAEARNGKAPEG